MAAGSGGGGGIAIPDVKPVKRMKVTLRHLPWNLAEQGFVDVVKENVGPDAFDAIDWWHYEQGKLTRMKLLPSTATLVAKDDETIRKLHQKFDGRNFTDPKGYVSRVTVEYAPNQAAPGPVQAADHLAGTIADNADYLAFVESLKAGTVPKGLSLTDPSARTADKDGAALDDWLAREKEGKGKAKPEASALTDEVSANLWGKGRKKRQGHEWRKKKSRGTKVKVMQVFTKEEQDARAAQEGSDSYDSDDDDDDDDSDDDSGSSADEAALRRPSPPSAAAAPSSAPRGNPSPPTAAATASASSNNGGGGGGGKAAASSAAVPPKAVVQLKKRPAAQPAAAASSAEPSAAPAAAQGGGGGKGKGGKGGAGGRQEAPEQSAPAAATGGGKGKGGGGGSGGGGGGGGGGAVKGGKGILQKGG
eukprot:Rhum_TRINITY_DN7490_c0_g1::Rhum_TRINITY_DN7490_c0_g1_i1::g.23137::m.23137/K14328/UPF3, RENT3; regulator of nonsense transcripts 3